MVDKYGNELKIGDWVLALDSNLNGQRDAAGMLQVFYAEPAKVVYLKSEWSPDLIGIKGKFFHTHNRYEVLERYPRSLEKLSSDKSARDGVVFLRNLEGATAFKP